MKRKQSTQKTSRILMLGAGFVAGPALEHLLQREENHVVLASQYESEATSLAGRLESGQERVVCRGVDLADGSAVEALVRDCDLVVSLVPAVFHPAVARSAIRNGKNMVTASYICPQLAQLDGAAKEAGVVILNEIGLDPGIDHMSAMQTITEVKGLGGRVKSFKSWCGGLPAPESSNNPLGYKFSWSAAGALRAARNDAVWTEQAKTVKVAGADLLKNPVKVDIFRGMATVGIPNRDSVKYVDIYGISGVETMFRGTLRYPGYCEVVQCFVDLGLFDDITGWKELEGGSKDVSWAAVLSKLCGLPTTATKAALCGAVASRLGGQCGRTTADLMESLEWLGLFSTECFAPKCGTLFGALCTTLSERLRYTAGERDMVLMQHIFVVEWKDHTFEEIKSTLCAYGDTGPRGHTAMSRTVGFPVGIVSQLLLDGGVEHFGVIRPVTQDIIQPVMLALQEKGITLVDERRKLTAADLPRAMAVVPGAAGQLSRPDTA